MAGSQAAQKMGSAKNVRMTGDQAGVGDCPHGLLPPAGLRPKAMATAGSAHSETNVGGRPFSGTASTQSRPATFRWSECAQTGDRLLTVVLSVLLGPPALARYGIKFEPSRLKAGHTVRATLGQCMLFFSPPATTRADVEKVFANYFLPSGRCERDSAKYVSENLFWDSDRAFIVLTYTIRHEHLQKLRDPGGGLQLRHRPCPADRHLVVERARRRLGRPYNLFTENCEHLATFAATGQAASNQVRSATIATGLAAAAITLFSAAVNAPTYDAHAARYRDRNGRFMHRGM
jgi:hypothetical protein